MRDAARTILTALLTLLSVVLGVASAITSAATLAATALIVPGTGTPNANIVNNYMAQACDRFMTTTPALATAASSSGSTTPGHFGR